jgi:hypothetical protein
MKDGQAVRPEAEASQVRLAPVLAPARNSRKNNVSSHVTSSGDNVDKELIKILEGKTTCHLHRKMPNMDITYNNY